MSKKIESHHAFWYAVLSCDAIEAIKMEYPGPLIEAQAAARASVLRKLNEVFNEIIIL